MAWLETNWDHNVILNKKDQALGSAIQKVTGQRIFYLPGDPTSEHLATYLMEKVATPIGKKLGVRCVSLRLYDNDEAWVEVA